MTRYAKTMSQAIAEVQVRELKMNDPKLIKVFDKLKPKDTIKLKVSSGISKGKDFQPYTVRAKNTLRNGVEKITMILQGNPTGVKRFLYKKDGKVTFAIGDMAASIDDIKEEVIHELVIEEVELDEGRMKDLLIKGQDLEAYAKKHGGIDKKDMMKVAAMLKKGDKSGALKYAKAMDTDPRDYILDLMGEEVELNEKYDLYHKSFSDAMQHAYDYAKKKLGITVDPKEIDDKVATGPKKPSVGKTNKYRLKGKGGNLQIQVYNKGGSKPFELNMYKEELGKEDEPKVKEIIKKLKGASQAHAGQAKDLEKAVSENSKGKEMSNEKLTDGNLSLKETVLKMWQEAVSPAQQAAIAISKKEKEKKEEPDEGNLFTKALKDARDKGEKTFTVAGKTYDVKTEKLVGGQKKLDKDKDGDIDGKDFALLRKSKKEEVELDEALKGFRVDFGKGMTKGSATYKDKKDAEQFAARRKKLGELPVKITQVTVKNANMFDDPMGPKRKKIPEEFSTPEYERYLQTKRGSLRESILKMWGEVVEEGYKPIKANHYDVKVTVKDKDVAKVKKIISNFKGDIEDVDSDQVDGGGMKFKGTGDIFIQGDDAGKLGMEIAKAVRTAKVMGEDKDLTKETKHGKNKMTDTGKEMTPVDMAPKMPKIKNEKNKV